jgi:L-rhamnose mutarotase
MAIAEEQKVERVCFVFELNPGAEFEYQRRHHEIWPEMTQLLTDAGISDYSIFSAGSRFTDGSLLIGVLKASPDWATSSSILARSDIQLRWGEAMHDLIRWQLNDQGDLLRLSEVFRQPPTIDERQS